MLEDGKAMVLVEKSVIQIVSRPTLHEDFFFEKKGGLTKKDWSVSKLEKEKGNEHGSLTNEECK